jgi:hypothetical protein
MQTPTSDRAFRAQLQKLLNERGDLFHFYSTRIANPAVDLTAVMRDLAIESARIDGDIAALLIEQGRPAEEDIPTDDRSDLERLHDDARSQGRKVLSMCTVVSKPKPEVSTRAAVTVYEKDDQPNAHVEARIAGILNTAAGFHNGRAQVL